MGASFEIAIHRVGDRKSTPEGPQDADELRRRLAS